MTKNDLKDCITSALQHNGGKAKLVRVCEYIWTNHKEAKLGRSFLYMAIRRSLGCNKIKIGRGFKTSRSAN